MRDRPITEFVDQTPNAPERVAEAWAVYSAQAGDPRWVAELVEVSVFVSTNHVYRLVFNDGSTLISKVSSYGSFFLFSEDHDRLHATHHLLGGTRHARLLADVLTVGNRPFTHYDGKTWVVFYEEVPRGRPLPKVLTEPQIVNLAQEIALFHRACADVAPRIPLTSTSIKADAIHLLDLVTNSRSTKRFALTPAQLAVVADHTHRFLMRLEELQYDYWPKIPVLLDWNLGNFSITPTRETDSPDDAEFRLYSRWDYDWFRIEPRMLDFYFLSRVSSSTGDRTVFTYSSHTLVEPRFVSFVKAYHRIFPLREADIDFLAEAYRFFILHYVIANGNRFFRYDLWKRLQREAVSVYLPEVERLDLSALKRIVEL
jgi:hypothetical protein